jgi:hypothetical protein
MSGYVWYGDGFKAEKVSGEDFLFEVYATSGLGVGCSCRLDISDLDAVHVSGLSIYFLDVQKSLMKAAIQFAQAFVTQLQEDALAQEEEDRLAFEDRLELIRETNRLT